MFKLEKCSGKIMNLNLRKEASGDDEGAVLAADVKLVLEGVPAEVLKQLAPTPDGAQTIVDSLFNDVGVPRFNSLTRMDFEATKFENHDVFISGKHFENSKLKGFALLKLHTGAKVDIELTAQVHPTKEQVGALSEFIKDAVKIETVGQPELGL